MKFFRTIFNKLRELVNGPEAPPSVHQHLNEATERLGDLSKAIRGAGISAQEAAESLREMCRTASFTLDQTHRLADPRLVKRLIPPSSFTKKGPGVTANLRRALLEMQPWQRSVAHRMGWDRGLCDEHGRMVRR